MKILIYGINFAPELTGIGKYSAEMAEWLAARGHDVRVVTAPPYYPAWSVSVGYSAKAWRREQWHGVNVFRCPLWVPGKPGGAKRLLHLASFALSSLPVMLGQLAWRPAVVWMVEPPLFCAPTALLVARLTGAKAWLHIQDYEVDAAFSLGLLKGPALKRWVLAGERWLMRRFDVVSTISQRMLVRAQDKGVDAAQLVMFPNWVDLTAFGPLDHRVAPGIVPWPNDSGGMAEEIHSVPGAVPAKYMTSGRPVEVMDVLLPVIAGGRPAQQASAAAALKTFAASHAVEATMSSTAMKMSRPSRPSSLSRESADKPRISSFSASSQGAWAFNLERSGLLDSDFTDFEWVNDSDSSFVTAPEDGRHRGHAESGDDQAPFSKTAAGSISQTNPADLSGLVKSSGDVAASTKLSAYRLELNVPADAVVALYSGNMGAKQGLEILSAVARLCALSQVMATGLGEKVVRMDLSTVPISALPINEVQQSQAPIFFVFCGNGVGRDALIAQCKGLRNVLFVDLQPAERLPDFLAMADIHLLPQRADAADLVMPSKLTGMLASGRPVVVTAHAETELAHVVKDCGLVVPPEDPQAMTDAILTLAADPLQRAQLGAAGRSYAAQHIEREAVLLKFEANLNRITANSHVQGQDDKEQNDVPLLNGAPLMSRRVATTVLVFLIIALMVGTQIPNAWRSTLEHILQASYSGYSGYDGYSGYSTYSMSSLAHCLIFSLISGVLVMRPLSWPIARIAAATFGMALLSEGLQFFAIDRHPRWIDVAIDMTGALVGIAVVVVLIDLLEMLGLCARR